MNYQHLEAAHTCLYISCLIVIDACEAHVWSVRSPHFQLAARLHVNSGVMIDKHILI